MVESRIPFVHIEKHNLEGINFRVVITVTPSGERKLIIQNEDKIKYKKFDEDKEPKITWLRDYKDFK